ncbi:MAG TPA: hypothetical protein VGK67_24640 [Myxococcales bacterium]|jgi:hypothetical protein
MARRIAIAGIFMAVLLGSLPARADFALGLGASGNFGIENKQLRLPDSWSVDGALGYRFTLGIVELTPELDLTYLRSTGSLKGNDVDWAFQAAAGGRIGVQIYFVVPSVYVLFGLGQLQFTSQDLVKHDGTGPYYEVGGAVDFRLGGSASLGVHAGYGSVSLSNVEADLQNAKINRVRAGVRLTLFL